MTRLAVAVALVGLGLATTALIVVNAVQWRRVEDPARNASRQLWTSIQSAKTPEALSRLQAQARALLRQQPLDYRAAAVLGEVEARRGKTEEARQLMQAAMRLNRRNLMANASLFETELAAKNYAVAFNHADIVLRQNPSLGRAFYPRIVATMDDPRAIHALAETLNRATNWREGFFQTITADQRLLQLTSALMTEMVGANGRILPQELSRLTQGLVNQGRYDQAYLNWLLLNPIKDVSKVRNVYDGDFEGWPSVTPFAWILGGGVIGSIEPIDYPERYGKALHIPYDGVSAVQFPRQMIMLTEGAYKLTTDYLTNGADDARHQLVVTCVNGEEAIAKQTFVDTRNSWKGMATTFSVPANCPAQWLAFMPLRGDRRASVQAWFDHVHIDRVETR